MKPLMTIAVALTVLAAPAVLKAAEGKDHDVTIEDLKYKPKELTIKVGDTVTWTNNDDREHTVVADDGSFKSGPLRSGKSFQRKFTKAGKYPYHDERFGRMSGVIIVKEK